MPDGREGTFAWRIEPMDSLSNRPASPEGQTNLYRLNAKRITFPPGRFIRLAAVALSVFTLFSPRMAFAISSVITVNSTADTATAGDGVCTLREAINNANSSSDTTSGDCTSGSASTIISFDAALAGQTIGLTNVGDTSAGPSALAVNTEIRIE